MASTIRMARLASRRPAWRDWIFCGAGGAAVGGLVMSTHLQSPAASSTEPSMVMGACQATLGTMSHLQPTLVLPCPPTSAGSRAGPPALHGFLATGNQSETDVRPKS